MPLAIEVSKQPRGRRKQKKAGEARQRKNAWGVRKSMLGLWVSIWKKKIKKKKQVSSSEKNGAL